MSQKRKQQCCLSISFQFFLRILLKHRKSRSHKQSKLIFCRISRKKMMRKKIAWYHYDFNYCCWRLEATWRVRKRSRNVFPFFPTSSSFSQPVHLTWWSILIKLQSWRISLNRKGKESNFQGSFQNRFQSGAAEQSNQKQKTLLGSSDENVERG